MKAWPCLRGRHLLLLYLVTTLHAPQHLLLDVPRLLQPPLPLHGRFGVRRLVQEPTLGTGQGAPSSVASAGLITCTAIAQPREPVISSGDGDRGRCQSVAWGPAPKALGTGKRGAGEIHFLLLQPTQIASNGERAGFFF